MSNFKIGDLVYTLEKTYSLTSPFHFYVGLVIDTGSGRRGNLQLMTVYSSLTESLTKVLFQNSTNLNKEKYAYMFDKYNEPSLSFVSSSDERQLQTLSYFFKNNYYFSTHRVSENFFKRLLPTHIEEAFEEMKSIQIQNEKLPSHSVFGNDYPAIHNDFIKSLRYLLSRHPLLQMAQPSFPDKTIHW